MSILCEEYFGGCPHCGASECLNIGADHWGMCSVHRVKWSIGSNLFSCWKEEDETVWRRNAATIACFAEVEPLREGQPIPIAAEAEALTAALFERLGGAA